MGELVDINAPYLAAQLPPLGIELQRITQANDDIGMLVEALQQSFQRSDLVLTTGGLGPTDDDLTREAIAQLVGETLYVDPQSLDHLKETFRQRGTSMPSTNVKQANLIPSGRSVLNAVGTAPGWWVEKDGKIMVAMPGPPSEMRNIWGRRVVPKLKDLVQGHVIITRNIKTTDLAEADVAERVTVLHPLERARGNLQRLLQHS